MDTEYEIDIHGRALTWLPHTFIKGCENQCFTCHLHGQPLPALMLALSGYTQVILVTRRLMLRPFSKVLYRIMRGNRQLIRVCPGTLLVQPDGTMVLVGPSGRVVIYCHSFQNTVQKKKKKPVYVCLRFLLPTLLDIDFICGALLFVLVRLLPAKRKHLT